MLNTAVREVGDVHLTQIMVRMMRKGGLGLGLGLGGLKRRINGRK